MIFNGIEKDFVTVLRGRVRPAWKSRGDTRVVSVPVKISHDGFTDLQRKKEEMAKWLIHDEHKFLEFKDEPDRLYLAEVESEMNLEEFPYWAEGEIEFVCKDKCSVERTISVNSVDGISKTINGHKSTFWRTHTVFSENQTSYSFAFYTESFALKDMAYIMLNYNFIKGDVLEIDYGKREAMLNGKDITNALVIIQSNFMELPIGVVNFGATHKTDFYYHERYY